MRWLKNAVGRFRGFGACPNCHDSWSWKMGKSFPVGKASEIIICKECLAKPKCLNPLTIEGALRKDGWDLAAAAMAREAVRRFKMSCGASV